MPLKWKISAIALSLITGSAVFFVHQKPFHAGHESLKEKPILTNPQLTEKMGNIPESSLKLNEVLSQLIEVLKPQEERLTFRIPESLQGTLIYEVKLKTPEKVIALTVDDGPWPKTTEAMLDIFQKNNVKATFFWVGTSVEKSPDLAKKVVAQGHAIGNHTCSHSYASMDEATAANEVDRNAELIYKTTGVKTFLFRPPGGILDNGVVSYAKQQKYGIVMWSLTSADTDPRAKPEAFTRNVVTGAKPGAIVLMHDGGGDRDRTIAALPDMIKGLKEQGYRFVTVPELLAMEEQGL
jgi:peptidoglycan/xylan/chitin deacetylase (PgdA/CDA1 family)